MNDQRYYWGIYGKTHRQIYEDCLRDKVDPVVQKALGGNRTEMKPGVLERILEAIFHTDRRIQQQAKDYRPSGSESPPQYH